MPIDGRYRIILNWPSGRQKATLEFATSGSTLSGNISGGGVGSIDFGDGRVDGNTLTWSTNGNPAAPQLHRCDCTATIAGDSIAGEADYGVLGTTWLRGSRIDPATGKSSIDDEPAIAWRDLGLPRFELGSVEWVNAMGEWLRARFEGQPLDFEFRWSVEYADPPTHLLRGDGRTTIGWHFQITDGTFEFGDGPLEGTVDFGGIAVPYEAAVRHTRWHTDEMIDFQEKALAATPRSQPPSIPEMDDAALYKLMRLNAIIAGPDNAIREEFFSQRTL